VASWIMGGLGMRELVFMLLVALVVFGAKKLRTVGSDLGRAVGGFKKAMSEGEEGQDTPPCPGPAGGRVSLLSLLHDEVFYTPEAPFRVLRRERAQNPRQVAGYPCGIIRGKKGH